MALDASWVDLGNTMCNRVGQNLADGLSNELQLHDW